MAIRKYYRKKIDALSKTEILKSKTGLLKESVKKKLQKEVKKEKWNWKKICLYFLLGVFIFFVLSFVYFARQLPNPKDFEQRVIKESTKIYDRTGKIVLWEAGTDIKRSYVELDEISPYLQKATIAAEDANFYHHIGVDFKGIARALYYAIFKRGQEIPGGSTITQQFIKNALLTPERTLSRKFKEAILALELERRYSKDQILEFYLNQVPYGSIYYGAESASEHYFGKRAKDLTLTEAATLAALPQAPTYYLKDVEAREARKNWILDRMVKLGYVSQKEADLAKKEKVVLQSRPEQMLAPYFVMYAREKLSEIYGEEYHLMGLKVYSTLNWDLQNLAERKVKEWGDKAERWYGAHNMGLVAINPNNGEILAMVGGRNFNSSQVNIWTPNNAQSFQSPGSTFKPIVYAAAFKRGYTPDTILWDVKTDFGRYTPENFDRKQNGPVKMKEALARSLNIPAVKTLYLAGIENVKETAKSMGMLKSFDEKIDKNPLNLSMAIGGKSIVPLELVGAFGTFPTEGYRTLPSPILKIEDRNGNMVWENDPHKVKVLDSEIARQINYILSDNSLRAPVFGWNSWINLGPWAAAKTGTAATEKRQVTDVWTIGYTRNLVVGVWAGNNHNEPLYKNADGVNVAGPVWYHFMKEATKNEPKIAFPKYRQIKTGKPILDGYLMGRHCILYWVYKENPRGPYPTNPYLDPQFINWEKAITGFVPTETAEPTPTPKPTATSPPKPTPTTTTTPTPTTTTTPSPSPTPTLTPTPTPTEVTPTP